MRRRSRPTDSSPTRGPRPERRSPLYLLTGLAIGLVSGLALAWLALPARLVDIAPADLGTQDKEDYRVMISLAFASSGDLGRAEARLGLLGDADPVRRLSSQAQLALLDPEAQLEARALGQLAIALGASLPETADFDPSGAPALANEAGFELQEEQLICEGEVGEPILMIFLLSSEGTPQAGAELRLSSGESLDETFTGLKPERGAGYAEFELMAETTYSLAIEGVNVLQNIEAFPCEEGGTPGSWLVTLQAE